MRFAAIVAVAVLTAAATGCAPAPHPQEAADPPVVDLSLLPDAKEDPDFNKAEILDQQIVLPAPWDARCDSLESLVGTALVLVPDRKSPTGHRLAILGQLLTPEGRKAVVLGNAGGAPRYRSRVDGRFASTLSFVPGRLEVRRDRVYELTVTDGRAARGSTEARLLDRRKLGQALSRLPKRYRDVLFVTAASQAQVVAQEYLPYAGPTGNPSSVVRLGVDYFQGADAPATRHALCLTVVSGGALFGDFDPKSCLYTRKAKIGKMNPKEKTGSLISFQTMKILRDTLAAGGLPLPD